jgi:hypothetical protein
MSATSASAPSPRIITPVIASLAGPDLSEFQRRKHRVPIGNHVNTQTFDDTLFLLRSYEVFDERKCVEEEIANVSSEIDALEQDRADLLQKVSFISLVNSSSLDDPDTVAPNNESTNNNTQWKDANRLLARAHNLSHKERVQLQEERGLYLTVCMYDAESRDALFEKCGVINSFSKQLKQHFFLYESSSTIKEVGPQDYPDGGGLATIQQIAFMKASTSDDSLSFVVGKDKDKSLVHGNIPDTLFMRIKRMGLDLKQHVAEIVYLATGPMGSYYAEFRNGACWWGIPGDDDDFDTVCNDAKWDVARVAFGPCIILYDAHQQPHYVNSWIIIGRNGRVAWKNVPSRLHNLLERRLSSAPACCEVALGSVGSYFVRFVDGTVDYCLPAEPARVCRSLEESGATIMSMSLHPELTHDFVIRSRR